MPRGGGGVHFHHVMDSSSRTGEEPHALGWWRDTNGFHFLLFFHFPPLSLPFPSLSPSLLLFFLIYLLSFLPPSLLVLTHPPHPQGSHNWPGAQWGFGVGVIYLL